MDLYVVTTGSEDAMKIWSSGEPCRELAHDYWCLDIADCGKGKLTFDEEDTINTIKGFGFLASKR